MGSAAVASSGLEFGISEAARMVGVSPATLRAWERDGLVHPVRTAAGYRRFSVEDLDHLRRVRNLRDVDGLNVPAIRLTLGQRTAPGSSLPSRRRKSDHTMRLRELRLKRGMSLRQASVKTGLSASFISLIERGLANSSMAVLQKLTASYGTSIADLLSGARQASQKLIRPSDRQVSGAVAGVKLEQLTFGQRLMEVHLFTVEPGAGSQEPYQHPGEEFMFVLEGTLEVWLDGMERFRVQPGDMLYFESSQAHQWSNPGDRPAVFLGVNTPATF
jgi:DNA-binding transcriptional MerR regulator/mannose-6-phosphate isomerase-like protein (cupin superfamily)